MVTNSIRSLTRETAMTLYMGVDFHLHQQTVCWCDLSTGELKTITLFHHAPKLKRF